MGAQRDDSASSFCTSLDVEEEAPETTAEMDSAVRTDPTPEARRGAAQHGSSDGSACSRPQRPAAASPPGPESRPLARAVGENLFPHAEIRQEAVALGSDRLAQILEKSDSQSSGLGRSLSQDRSIPVQPTLSKSQRERLQQLPDARAISLSAKNKMHSALVKLTFLHRTAHKEETVRDTMCFGDHPAAGVRSDSANLNYISPDMRATFVAENADNFARIECGEMKDKKQLVKRSKIANTLRLLVPCVDVNDLALVDVRINRSKGMAPSTAAPAVSISSRRSTMSLASRKDTTSWEVTSLRSLSGRSKRATTA